MSDVEAGVPRRYRAHHITRRWVLRESRARWLAAIVPERCTWRAGVVKSRQQATYQRARVGFWVSVDLQVFDV